MSKQRIEKIRVNFLFEYKPGFSCTYYRFVTSDMISWCAKDDGDKIIYKKHRDSDQWYEVQTRATYNGDYSLHIEEIPIPKIELEYQRDRMMLEKDADYSPVISADDLGLI